MDWSLRAYCSGVWCLIRNIGPDMMTFGIHATVQVREVSSIIAHGSCKNGVCEIGEQCISANNTDCCVDDCPLIRSSCPIGASSTECNRQGLCNRTSATCKCFAGFQGDSCGSCAQGWSLFQGDDDSLGTCLPIQDSRPPPPPLRPSPPPSPLLPTLPPPMPVPPMPMLPIAVSQPESSSDDSSVFGEIWFLVVIIGGGLIILMGLALVLVRYRHKQQRTGHAVGHTAPSAVGEQEATQGDNTQPMSGLSFDE